MPRIAKENPSKRMTLNIPIDIRKEMEEVRELIGAETLSEVVRRAVSAYALLARQRKQGCEIQVKLADGSTKIILF